MGRVLDGWWQMRAPWKALDLLYQTMSPALGSPDDKAAGIAVDLRAMMMHHHHHRIDKPIVETMIWSKLKKRARKM